LVYWRGILVALKAKEKLSRKQQSSHGKGTRGRGKNMFGRGQSNRSKGRRRKVQVLQTKKLEEIMKPLEVEELLEVEEEDLEEHASSVEHKGIGLMSVWRI
jgi:hypothetical protein